MPLANWSNHILATRIRCTYSTPDDWLGIKVTIIYLHQCLLWRFRTYPRIGYAQRLRVRRVFVTRTTNALYVTRAAGNSDPTDPNDVWRFDLLIGLRNTVGTASRGIFRRRQDVPYLCKELYVGGSTIIGGLPIFDQHFIFKNFKPCRSGTLTFYLSEINRLQTSNLLPSRKTISTLLISILVLHTT